MKTIKVKKLHPNAIIPTRNNGTDAGLDLYAAESFVIPPTLAMNYRTGGQYPVQVGRAVIDTGIAFEIPTHYEGSVRPRSGMMAKSGVFTGYGTIDSDYRGSVKVVLFNTTSYPYEVKAGDKIAQLVISSCELPTPEEVDELSDTTRGENGFGSSGR